MALARVDWTGMDCRREGVGLLSLSQSFFCRITLLPNGASIWLMIIKSEYLSPARC